MKSLFGQRRTKCEKTSSILQVFKNLVLKVNYMQYVMLKMSHKKYYDKTGSESKQISLLEIVNIVDI